MEWEAISNSDRTVPGTVDMSRSFSTSTPFIHSHEWRKLNRSLSASIISTTSNDSGLGDSLSELTISQLSDSDLPCGTTTINTQTPTFSIEPEWHGHQLDLSGSPLLRKNHFMSIPSIDCESTFISDSDTTFNLSEVNLNSSVCKVRKLNLDLDLDEVATTESNPVTTHVEHRMSDKSFMIGELNLMSNERNSAPELMDIDILSDMLEKFSPEVTDRLIGRRMGRERVDIVGQLSTLERSLVTDVMSYLDPGDLCSMCLVNKTWKSICVGDSRANARRRRYLKQRKKSLIGKENLGKRVSGRVGRLVTGPAGVLQSLATVQAVSERLASPPLSPSKNTKDLFAEAAKDLKIDEKLQHCPRCRKPAKVLPVQDRGKCCNTDCLYDYCTRCMYDFHGSRTCIPIASKRPKTDVVGTKKSKKNLKRL